MGRKTLYGTSFEGYLTDVWKEGNDVRQGGVTSDSICEFVLK